jgi:hypothetical protein
MRLSLEDIFLKLTTVEAESEDLAAEAAIGAGSEGGDAHA